MAEDDGKWADQIQADRDIAQGDTSLIVSSLITGSVLSTVALQCRGR